MTPILTGIHHLTAVTARAKQNLDFYTKVLGMRLVKKTVNQDDTSAYHLFYGDGVGSPGSDITFFDWPAKKEVRGTNSAVRTALRVSGEGTFDWWFQHLRANGVSVTEPAEIDGRLSLPFDDPEGQRLLLIDDGGSGEAFPWSESPVPPEHQIRGLGPITLSVSSLSRLDLVIAQIMNMTKVREYSSPFSGDQLTHVYEMGDGGVHAELHVIEEPSLNRNFLGAGGVHHVAFRTPDYESLNEWVKLTEEIGIRSSGEVERFYFRSLYFREPNGILFEIATDIPGFHADEPVESLGTTLSLPPFLEPQRAQIEAGLKPLS